MAGGVLTLSFTGTALAVNFEPGPGTYTVNTTALTLTGPGTSINGTDQGGVAVFSFDAVSIAAGVQISVEGTRPFRLVSSGDLALGGSIEGNGRSAQNFILGPLAGGPGGSAGGTDATEAGKGAGGGGIPSNSNSGAGGGGFGGAGARGGANGGIGGAGGVVYDPGTFLQGGSGGGGAASVGGGGGGGVIQLFAASVRIVPNGKVLVEGGGGAVGAGGASGGGSGGGLLVHADTTLQMDGLLSVAGGDGGLGGCCGGGGGGGGGRVALEYRTLSVTGLIDVSGGVSNSRDTPGCACGGGIVGDPTGAPGVYTKTQLPSLVVALTPPPTPSPAPAPVCLVPKLVGKKAGVAKEALKKANCSPGVVAKSYSAKVKKGRVIRQSVKAGKQLPAGGKVGLKVSKGEKPLR